MLYWWSKFVLLGPLLKLVFRPTIEGVEHVPERGGAILASNHLAVADSFFLPLKVPRRITFLAKREYFTQPGLVGRLKKMFFTGVGQVPIDRSSGSAAQAAMDTGVPVIPVAMIGTDRVNPIGSRVWRPRKVHIKVGEPLDFSRYAATFTRDAGMSRSA